MMRSPGIYDPWDDISRLEMIVALLLLQLADRHPEDKGLNRDLVVGTVRTARPTLSHDEVATMANRVVSWGCVNTHGWRITTSGLRALRDLRCSIHVKELAS